jgi:hypothetical protein
MRQHARHFRALISRFFCALSRILREQPHGSVAYQRSWLRSWWSIGLFFSLFSLFSRRWKSVSSKKKQKRSRE